MGQDDDNMHMGPPHYKKDEFNGGFNNKITLTATVSLLFVIVLVIVLHIYARCLIRRQERRASALRHLRRTSTVSVSVSVNQLVLPPRSGLDPAVIASLPIFPFKADDHEEAQTECSVCLSLLETDEMVRKLPDCNHTFHAPCIDTWLRSQSTCPVCRTEAEPRSGHHLSPEPCHLPTTTAHPEPEVLTVGEETSGCGPVVPKVESSSRLSSFRRILSRERSSRRVDSVLDPERQ